MHGDFNRDGFGDIALVGGSGWSTIPIAFSDGDGTFLITNEPVPNFPVYAQQNGAKPVAGDFNKDGLGRHRPRPAESAGDRSRSRFSYGDGTFRV